MASTSLLQVQWDFGKVLLLNINLYNQSILKWKKGRKETMVMVIMITMLKLIEEKSLYHSTTSLFFTLLKFSISPYLVMKTDEQYYITGTDSEVVIIDNSEAFVWPEKHEEIFIELMEEEVLKGNRNTKTFTKQSWKRIKEELYAQAKRSYTDTQLRNKYNLLRQKYKDFKFLMKETGVGFSVVTGQLTAPDEVWDRLIRVNKSAKKFRKNGCILYGKLCVIFGDTTTTGSNAHPSTRSPSINLDNDDDDAMSKSPSIRNQKSSFDEDGSKRRGKSTSTTSSRSAKKAKFSLALAETLTVYNETAKRKMEVYRSSQSN
ncbi:hypothetical protein F8388_005685 [Cannabis sativa]|uniref:Myb/SANT-like domain-containing protein n=1 Tax=Cannabis sativa TaxID=3483 RepID=A0A7J6H6E7_CANSA|nr:hypothetical protein F8388_005685 [Cannabis sativa]